VDAAIAKMLEDLLKSGGTQVKTGLDYFLEELSVMAVAGTLQHGRHYVYQSGRLALHFGACHAHLRPSWPRSESRPSFY